MKFSFVLMMVFFLHGFFSACVTAEPADPKYQQKTDNITTYGPFKHQGGTFDGLNVMGPATLCDVNVRGEAVVNGPLKAENSSFQSLQINGPVTLKKVIVQDKAVINGPLKAQGSELKDISIATSELSLDDTTVQNITVRADGRDKSKKQIIHLNGDTVVKGKITFESENGFVITHGNAKDEGMIEGGKLIKE